MDISQVAKPLGIGACALVLTGVVGNFAATGVIGVLSAEQAIADSRVATADQVDEPDAVENDAGGDDQQSDVLGNDSAKLSAEVLEPVRGDAKVVDENVERAEKRDAVKESVKETLSTYHINEGDTLSAISAVLGVSVDALAHANEIDDVDLIYADSALVVPEAHD